MSVAAFPPEGNGPYRLLRRLARGPVAAFERGCADPEGLQRARLAAILRAAQGTAFAADHGLAETTTAEAFRARVPVRTDAEYGPWLERAAAGERGVLTAAPVVSLLQTSGTTGPAKLLPVTEAYAREVEAGQALWRLGLVRDHEAVTRGTVLTLASPGRQGRTEGGMAYGANTGRMQARQHWLVRARYAAPAEVTEIRDPDARLYLSLRFALQSRVRLLVTANPSSVLRMARFLGEHLPDLEADLAEGGCRRCPGVAATKALPASLARRLRRGRGRGEAAPGRAWDLAAVACWKGGAAPWFLARLPDALGARVPVRDVGITASEGYFGIPLTDDDAGGVAWLGGHVMEFIEAWDGGAPGAVRWAWDLEEGRRYRLVVTTSAGLYRYDLADVVEVTGFVGRAPVLRFVRKAGAVLSLTGEKVTEDQVVRAVSAAVGGRPVRGFSVGHGLADPPSLTLSVEGASAGDLPGIAERFDAALRAGNVEYDDKRGTRRLGPAEARRLPPGTYDRWRAARIDEGAPAEQLKDPVILADAEARLRLDVASGAPDPGPDVEPATAGGTARAVPAALHGLKAVSWDLDGTLYELPKVVRAVGRAAAGQLLSLRAPQAAAELWLLSGFRSAMERVRAGGGHIPDGLLDSFMAPRARIIELERAWYGPAIAAAGPWDGVLDLLALFEAAGLRQVVVSDYVGDWKLEALGLAGRFDRVYAGERLGVLKPSPALFEAVVADLGVAPGEVLHLGDRPETDGVAAADAGLRVRIFDAGFLTPRGLLATLERGRTV